MFWLMIKYDFPVCSVKKISIFDNDTFLFVKTKYPNINTCYFKIKKPSVPEIGQSDRNFLGLIIII